MENRKKILVVGAGAAGLMAAVTACKNNDVTLIKKNAVLGKKLRITGKGRCNVTNNCTVDDFLKNVITNKKFLFSALYSFSPADIMNFFERNGLSLKTERGNRVFPTSDDANDVVETFKNILKKNNCKILKGDVKSLIISENDCKAVILKNGKKLNADAVIIATGGKSYPQTGSTGQGYKLAKNIGHKIIPLKPSLVPLECEQHFCKDLQGLTLKNVTLSIFDKSKNMEIYKDFGEMIFTLFGISGPLVLSASCHLINPMTGKYTAKVDLKPALTEKELDKRIIKDLEKYSNKNFDNSLNDLLPKKLIPVVVKLSGISPYIKCHQVTKEMRLKLVHLLKGLLLDITQTRPLEEAIITSGGIDVTEINPKTMQSKLVNNLYFAGEILDVDAYTGGYNLQIAFSTGFLAGSSV